MNVIRTISNSLTGLAEQYRDTLTYVWERAKRKGPDIIAFTLLTIYHGSRCLEGYEALFQKTIHNLDKGSEEYLSFYGHASAAAACFVTAAATLGQEVRVFKTVQNIKANGENRAIYIRENNAIEVLQEEPNPQEENVRHFRGVAVPHIPGLDENNEHWIQ